jgi:hypothetical protein
LITPLVERLFAAGGERSLSVLRAQQSADFDGAGDGRG